MQHGIDGEGRGAAGEGSIDAFNGGGVEWW